MGDWMGKKKRCKWELVFKVRPGRLEVASATTKKGVMSNVKNLRKFGLKKGSSSTSLKTGEYFYKKICKVK